MNIYYSSSSLSHSELEDQIFYALATGEEASFFLFPLDTKTSRLIDKIAIKLNNIRTIPEKLWFYKVSEVLLALNQESRTGRKMKRFNDQIRQHEDMSLVTYLLNNGLTDDSLEAREEVNIVVQSLMHHQYPEFVY